MGIFKKKKQTTDIVRAEGKGELRDDISKAYDELVSGEVNAEADAEKSSGTDKKLPLDLGMELLKSKIGEFREKKTQEALFEVLKLLPSKQFLLPSVSNIKSPFETVDGKPRLKKGAELNPALLTSQDKKVFLPVFTDEAAMTQKTPSGVVLRFKFEQCAEMVLNDKLSITGMVINPFSENMILGGDLLKTAFKKVEKN